MLAARIVGTTKSAVGAGALDAAVTDMAAENGQSGPRVGVTDDGNATMAWTESPAGGVYHVYARALTGPPRGRRSRRTSRRSPAATARRTSPTWSTSTRPAPAPRWVVFRQQFKYGAFNVPHAIARSFRRRLRRRPSRGWPPVRPRAGRGVPACRCQPGRPRALGAARQDLNEPGQNDVLGSTLAGGAWATGFRVDSIDNDTDVPTPVAAVGDDGGGAWAWHEHVDATTARRFACASARPLARCREKPSSRTRRSARPVRLTSRPPPTPPATSPSASRRAGG